jgi:hypothetical protein
MVTVDPFSVAVMFVIVEPLKVSLNTKRAPPPAPVSTNLFPLLSTTSKLTLVPDCVSVTVPKFVEGHPPVIWHDVNSNVSADALGAPAVRRNRPATDTAVNVMRFIYPPGAKLPTGAFLAADFPFDLLTAFRMPSFEAACRFIAK